MMVQSVSLKEVLRTGEFGNLRFGLSESEVLALLGQPDDVGTMSRKQRRPLLWKYGDVELHFDEADIPTLSGVVINFWKERIIPTGGSAINLDPWIIKGGLQWSDLRPRLDKEAIDYRVTEPLNFDTTEIGVGPAALLIFNDNENEITGLCKVLFLARLGSFSSREVVDRPLRSE